MGKRGLNSMEGSMEDLQHLWWKMAQDDKSCVLTPHWSPVERFLKQAIKKNLLTLKNPDQKDPNAKRAKHSPSPSHPATKKDTATTVKEVFYMNTNKKDSNIFELQMKKYHLPASKRTPNAWFRSTKKYLNKETIVGILVPEQWDSDTFIEVAKQIVAIAKDLICIVPTERKDSEKLIFTLREQLIEADLCTNPSDTSKTINHFFFAAASNHDPQAFDQLLESDTEKEKEKPMEVDENHPHVPKPADPASPSTKRALHASPPENPKPKVAPLESDASNKKLPPPPKPERPARSSRYQKSYEEPKEPKLPSKAAALKTRNK